MDDILSRDPAPENAGAATAFRFLPERPCSSECLLHNKLWYQWNGRGHGDNALLFKGDAFVCKTQAAIAAVLDKTVRQTQELLWRLEARRVIRRAKPAEHEELRNRLKELQTAKKIKRFSGHLSDVYFVLVAPKDLERHLLLNPPPVATPRKPKAPRGERKPTRAPRGKLPRADQPTLFDEAKSTSPNVQSASPNEAKSTSPNRAKSTSPYEAKSASPNVPRPPLEVLRVSEFQQQQQSEKRAAGAAKNEPPENAPKHRAEARQALQSIDVWETHIEALLDLGAGLCLLAVALAREKADFLAKFARCCIENPQNFGVTRLPKWDADDPYSGWRAPPKGGPPSVAKHKTRAEIIAYHKQNGGYKPS